MKPRLCHTSFASFVLINGFASGVAVVLFWAMFGIVPGCVAGGWTIVVFFLAFLLGADLPDDAHQ